MTRTYRRLLKISRIAHLYLTLFGLVLILFFAASGFMLNHEDWFLPLEPRVRYFEGNLSTAVLNTNDRLDISEAVRREFDVVGIVNSYRSDELIEIEYLRPGERTVVEVRRETGETVVTTESKGWSGVMVDLHKGKSAGSAWGLVIDGVCVLLGLISATGLVLWTSLKSRGKWGAVMLIFGGLLTFAIYYWLVP